MANSNQIESHDVQSSVAMLDSLYSQAFFSKLAEYGYTPSTQEEAVAMLETAYQLDAVDSADSTKQAEEKVASPYADANAKLKEVLASQGVGPSAQEVEQAGIKQAAAALAQDSDLYKAVLTIKAAEAEAIERLSQNASEESTEDA